MSSATADSARDAGFTLVEVLIAMVLIAGVATGVAQLFAIALSATQAARHQTSTTVLAVQKMEQLRSLTWSLDAAGSGLPVSDTTTDLSTEPATTSGAGLNPSPAGTIATSTPGYVDYLDARGTWVGTGVIPPATALYIRRWSIEPAPTDPNNTLLLHALVTTTRRDARGRPAGRLRERLADEALLATIKTRKVWSS